MKLVKVEEGEERAEQAGKVEEGEGRAEQAGKAKEKRSERRNRRGRRKENAKGGIGWRRKSG